MKATSPWITYRTRFLVQAKQLGSPLNFTDSLGRQHSGRKGDYLVESSDGVLRIAPRQIFEDIYVPLVCDSVDIPQPNQKLPRTPASLRDQVSTPRETPAMLPPPLLARKSPQPHRDRRHSVMGNANVERAF
jgi:hypothetical protein